MDYSNRSCEHETPSSSATHKLTHRYNHTTHPEVPPHRSSPSPAPTIVRKRSTWLFFRTHNATTPFARRVACNSVPPLTVHIRLGAAFLITVWRPGNGVPECLEKSWKLGGIQHLRQQCDSSPTTLLKPAWAPAYTMAMYDLYDCMPEAAVLRVHATANVFAHTGNVE